MPKPIALSKNRTVNFVMEGNRKDPGEDQVVFQIRAVPFAIRMDILNSIAIEADESGDGGGGRVDVGRKFKLACRHGLTGWSDNFTDTDGDALAWSAAPKKKYGVEIIDDDCLAQLPDDVITGVGDAIIILATSEAHEVGK